MPLAFEVNQQSGAPISAGFWQRSAKKIQKAMKLKGSYTASVAVLGDRATKNMNRLYRQIDKTTDVLSFGRDKKNRDFWPQNYLGEIIICYPQARRQAKIAQKPLGSEIELLLAHGFLHLRGYDHKKAGEARKMEVLQEKIIKTKI